MPKKEPTYRLKPGRLGQKVIGAYQAIEDGVVGTYKKIETAFVDRFLEEVNDEPNQTNNH